MKQQTLILEVRVPLEFWQKLFFVAIRRPQAKKSFDSASYMIDLSYLIGLSSTSQKLRHAQNIFVQKFVKNFMRPIVRTNIGI